MLTLLGSPRTACDGVTRRETLRVGALSLLGGFFNLPSLLALERSQAARRPRPKVRSVLLLYLQGGPATQDMFDMKPDVPADYRGLFKPVQTRVPGMDICELLPLLAKSDDLVEQKAVVARIGRVAAAGRRTQGSSR